MRMLSTYESAEDFEPTVKLTVPRGAFGALDQECYAPVAGVLPIGACR